MGTAAFGSGILKGLDVPGAIDLLTGYLDHLGDYDPSVALLPENGRLEALLTLTAGDGVTFHWDVSREQLSIEAEDTDGCGGIARALGLLAVCLEGPAVIAMLGETGRSWRYVLADGDVIMRPAGMNVDGPILALRLSALAWHDLGDQPPEQGRGGGPEGIVNVQQTLERMVQPRLENHEQRITALELAGRPAPARRPR